MWFHLVVEANVTYRVEEVEPLKVIMDERKGGQMWHSCFLKEFGLGCSQCAQDCNTVLDCIQFILQHTHTQHTHCFYLFIFCSLNIFLLCFSITIYPPCTLFHLYPLSSTPQSVHCYPSPWVLYLFCLIPPLLLIGTFKSTTYRTSQLMGLSKVARWGLG